NPSESSSAWLGAVEPLRSDVCALTENGLPPSKNVSLACSFGLAASAAQAPSLDAAMARLIKPRCKIGMVACRTIPAPVVGRLAGLHKVVFSIVSARRNRQRCPLFAIWYILLKRDHRHACPILARAEAMLECEFPVRFRSSRQRLRIC